MSTSESSLECNIPSSNACICHMSTTTLGITEMLEQTENKKKLMLNETLTQLFLGENAHMAITQAEV